MQVSVLGKLRVTGALALTNDTDSFPANPSVGTITIKGEMLYAYLTLVGITNWYPLVRLPERYVHAQTSPSAMWTVVHNLNKTDIWYQVQDSNGQLMMAGEFTEIDSNSFTLSFSEPVQGKVLVLGSGLDGEQQQPQQQSVTLASITDWPAGITAQELGYLDGLTSTIQAQLDSLASSVSDHSTRIGTLEQQVASSTTSQETLQNKTLEDVTLIGSITEAIYAITGTTPSLDPANGTIQTWTLSGNSAPTFNLQDGQSLTAMIADGTNFTITWPSVSWVGGSAPTLATTGQTVVVFWKVGGVVYGSRVGDV